MLDGHTVIRSHHRLLRMGGGDLGVAGAVDVDDLRELDAADLEAAGMQ